MWDRLVKYLWSETFVKFKYITIKIIEIIIVLIKAIIDEKIHKTRIFSLGVILKPYSCQLRHSYLPLLWTKRLAYNLSIAGINSCYLT